MEDWAEIVKTVRKKEKMTQREFAKKIGVRNFEPRMKERRKLAEMCKELKIDKDRDIEIMRFIHTLMNNIPDRILNDKELKIYDLKTRKDCGNLKEYISERLKALFGVSVEWGEEKKD